MIHVRTRLTADFTVIANALVQRRGSAVTVGVAAYILSLPDGAIVSIAALCAHFDEGEILISRALRELESAGYLERRRERGPDGQVRTRTYFYDVPRGEGPQTPPPNRVAEARRCRERSGTPARRHLTGLGRTGTGTHSYGRPRGGDRSSIGFPTPARRHRPPSPRHPRLPPDRRPQTGPLRPRGHRTGPGRRRVAHAGDGTGGDHQLPHQRPTFTLPVPPRACPRVPAPRDPGPHTNRPERPTARPVRRTPLADLRRLRTGLQRRGTVPLPGLLTRQRRRPPPASRMTTRCAASRPVCRRRPPVGACMCDDADRARRRWIMVDRFSDGLLTPAETSSCLEIPSSTLASWLKATAAGAPLVHQVEPVRRGQPSVPFIAVAEAHVLRSLRTLGLRMSEIREAAAAVRDAFDTPYGLVSKRIATDGVDIFVEHGFGDLRRARDGQVPIDEVVSGYLRYLIWEADDDFPTSLRLRQYPDSVPVVIDPRFGHGLPVIAANRVPVKAVTDLWEAGETVEEIAYEYDMTPEQVDSVCHAVVRLAA
ncbi:hypothetical protein SLCG_4817 [Streptomyces lincolnensis]|nr:hypothetical protein SLCG_4817 [Streptomyces lincolnensis]